MASLVQRSVDFSSLIEIDWTDATVVGCLVRYSKTTILHYFIYSVISEYYRRHYRKNHDGIEDNDIKEIEDAFINYGISFQSYFKWIKKNRSSEDCSGEAFYRWFDHEYDAFTELWENITEEVFYLLFANRQFLLDFNKSLAGYFEGGDISIPYEHLNSDRTLKRAPYLPQWLKKAIFYRDRGRCVLCNTDLSGLMDISYSRHFDHVVPLQKWGVNDPCNLQLLCEHCNLSKSYSPGTTSRRYQPWW